jgi:hypothetical protein
MNDTCKIETCMHIYYNIYRSIVIAFGCKKKLRKTNWISVISMETILDINLSALLSVNFKVWQYDQFNSGIKNSMSDKNLIIFFFFYQKPPLPMKTKHEEYQNCLKLLYTHPTLTSP